MKNTILIVACSLALVGCGPHQSQTTSQVGFVEGAAREDIIHQLEQMHATMLTNTPDLLRAEFTAPESKRPMQVELTFHEGKLAGVNIIPQ